MNHQTRRILFDSILKVAQIHSGRLQKAMQALDPFAPFSEEFVGNLSDEQIAYFEFFIHRFMKLQDLMGTKLFPLVLEISEEPVKGPGFLDMLDVLEKLCLLDNAEQWRDIRETRNHLAHEYPDQPYLTVKYLNIAYDQASIMLATLERMVIFARKSLG